MPDIFRGVSNFLNKNPRIVNHFAKEGNQIRWKVGLMAPLVAVGIGGYIHHKNEEKDTFQKS